MTLLFKIGFLEIGWVDAIDIFLVTILIFQIYQLVKGSVAVRILLGGFAIFMLWLIVRALEMELLSTILGQFIGVGVLGGLILFQQEIRKFLLVIGKANYLSNNSFLRNLWRSALSDSKVPIDVFISASQEMSASLTGALVVFTRSSELKFYAESGDEIDAIASKRLIIAIFNKYSPLHDGAMIVDKMGRIVAARCILPVSENNDLPASLGLRHRSAIGLTEVSDAVVLVVSEETGHISIVSNGKINRNLSPDMLRQKLETLLTIDSEEKEKEEELNKVTSEGDLETP